LNSAPFTAGLNLMRQIGQAINVGLNPGELIWTIYLQTHNVIPADVFTLSLCLKDPGLVDYFAVENNQQVRKKRTISPLTAWVVEHRQPVLIQDTRREPMPVKQGRLETGLMGEPRSGIVVPMISRENVVGVISVHSYVPGGFSAAHQEILSAIASHSAVVIENAQLLAQSSQRATELASLERLGYELARRTNLAELLMAVIAEAKDLSKADAAVIYAYHERRGQFQPPAYAVGLPRPDQLDRLSPFPRAEGLTTQIVKRRSAITTLILGNGEIRHSEIPARDGFDLGAMRDFPFEDPDTVFVEEQRIRASVGVPLVAGNDLVGVLYINHCKQHEFSQEEFHTIGRLAQHAAAAIQKANVYDEISTLHEAGKTLTGQMEMKAVLEKLFEYGHTILGADLITLFPYHAATDEFDLPPVVSGEVYEPEKIAAYGIRPDDIARRVVKEAREHFSREAQEDEVLVGTDLARRPTRFVGRERIASAAAVPLKAEREVVGALFFNYRAKQRFGSHHQMLMQTFAHYAAVAIQRARFVGRRVGEMNALAEIDKVIVGGALPDVLDKIIKLACEIVGVRNGGIFLADLNRRCLSRVVLFGADWQADLPQEFKIGENGVTGWVAHHKRPARIGDVQAGEWQGIYVESLPGARSELAVPILDEQNNLVGVINLESRTASAFSEDDEQLLMALAGQAYIAIRNQRQFEAEQRRVKQLQVAAEVARDATTARGLEHLLNSMVNLVRDRFGFYHAGIFLLDEQRKYAVLKAATGEAGRKMLEQSHKLKVGEVGIVGHATSTGRPRIAGDVRKDETHYLNPFLPETRAEMALPFKVGDRVIGALDVQSTKPDAFDDDDIAVLQIMADQLAVAIENARLFEAEQSARQVQEILSEVDRLIIAASVASEGEAANASAVLEGILHSILVLGLKAIGAPAGHVMLYDKVRGDLYIAAVAGAPTERRGDRQKLSEGIIGKTARERRTHRVADITSSPWDDVYLPLVPGTRSEIAVPLLRGDGRLVGVFNAESPVVGRFSRDDEESLEALAQQAVIAYQTVERYQVLQKLREINQLLASGAAPDEVIKLLLYQACDFIKAEWGNLRLYDDEGQPALDYVTVKSALGPEPEIQVADLRGADSREQAAQGIVAWVARTREFYRSQGDAQADPRFRSQPGWNNHSEMAVPLMVGPTFVGVLNLESERREAFDAEDEDRLLDFASQAAVAVRDARHIEAARESRARFEILNEVGREIINAPLDEEKILEIVLDAGLKRTGAFHAVAWQPEPGGEQLLARLVLGDQRDARHEPISFGQYVNGRAWQERRLILVDDTDKPPDGIQYRPGFTSARSLLVVPILVGDEYFGNLDFRHRRAYGFKAEEIELVKGLTMHAAAAIRRARRERELEEIRQRESEAQTMVSIGLAAGELAHRIGNKLGLVETHVREIQEEIGPGPIEANRLLELILDNAKYLLGMTRQLRQELGGPAGRPASQKIEFSAEFILAEMRQLRTLPPGIQVRVTPLAADCRFLATKDIFHAFTNIYLNAVEALEGRGGVITLSANQANGWVEFQIADSGPGIEEQKVNRIFNLFYSTKPNSLGFGLWSAKQRVLASGGQVSVQSKLGEGTTFTIRLPAVSASESTP
jgi:GAF domain-containing protein